MKIVSIKADGLAVADIGGVQNDVDLSLIENPCVGDYVIVHTGFAIERLDEAEAQSRLKMFQEIAQLN